MVTRKKVFLESSHLIETNLGVVVEFLEVQSSVYFEFCLDEELIGFWLAGLMFQSPHATNFCRLSTVQWWSPHFSRYHSVRAQNIWRILLGWRLFQSLNMIRDFCDHCFEVFCELHNFLVWVLLVGFHLLLVGFNYGLHDDKLFIILVIHIVAYLWSLEAWGMKISITEIEQWLWFGAIWRRWALMSK